MANTVQDIAYKLDNEGTAYYILNYASPDDMPSEAIKEAFVNARHQLMAFRDALLNEVDPEDQDTTDIIFNSF